MNSQTSSNHSIKETTYKILYDKQIGKGGFGSLYKCIETSSGNDQLAVKLETISTTNDTSSKKTSLYLELKVLKYLQGGIGVPRFISYGSSSEYNYLIMELLSDNLNDIFHTHNEHCSLENIINISIQMLDRIEFLHSKGFIHRDIKPENFALGNKKSNRNIVYLIDYGLTKPFINKNTKMHIPYSEGKKFVGTLRYASPNSHFGIALSRRGDLISFTYCVMYFINGSLPWEKIKKRKDDDTYADILTYKLGITSDNAYNKENIHPNLIKIVTYVMGLKFEEMPNYNYIRKLIIEINDGKVN